MIIELQHNKTNKMTCAPSEDSDQPDLISLHCPHEETLGPSLPIGRTAKTSEDQSGRIPRLILVFAGRTCHFVSFVIKS